MTKQAKYILGLGLGLILITGFGLQKVSGSHQLGSPGLKLAERPLESESGVVITNLVVALPFSIGESISKPLPITQEELDWLPKDTLYGRRVYSTPDGFETMISVVLMGRDRTSIHKPQYCLPGQGWVIEKTEEIEVELHKKETEKTVNIMIPAMKLSLKRHVKLPTGEEGDILGHFIYWFVSEDQITADHKQRMYWMAKDLLKDGILKRWAYVAYFSTCLPEKEEELTSRLNEFIAESAPTFMNEELLEKP